MRHSCFVFLMLFFSAATGLSQNVGINATGNDPDTSAMLDVASTNKGLLIPQINISSLSDAATIASPAHSLLVYNTNAALTGGKGYYYNSGTTGSPSWIKLGNSGSVWNLTGNSGTTPGTDFIGTIDSADLVFKTKNISRFKVAANGISTIGEGTNQVKIETDGSLTLMGNATTFNDIVVPIFASKLGGSRNPIWAKMKDNGSGSRGVYTYTFEDQASADAEEEVYFSVQMPHNWKEGSDIEPHVHWAPQTTGKNGSVLWGLEYTWVNYISTAPIAFPNTTMLTTTSVVVNGSNDIDKHFISSFGQVTPGTNQNKVSSVLMCRFFRNSSNAADTYQGNAAVLSIDFHYEIDSFGSHDEYVK